MKENTLTMRRAQDFLLNYALYIVLALMIVIFVIIEPGFLSINNFVKIVTQASTRGIMALGVAGLIVLQGTDLSAGRVLGLCAIVSSSLFQAVSYGSRMYPNLPALPFWVPLLVAVIIGGIFGAINGFGVSKLHLHAFIVTLGTQLIAYGVGCIYIDRPPLGAQPVANFDSRYTALVNGDVLGVPYLIIYLAVVSIVMWFIWNKTRLGKNMFAIGGNPEAAAVSGVNIAKNIMIIFIISGMLYGVAGFLEGGRIGSTNSNTGINYELDAISACVVGGVSFSGGVGTIPGVLIGAMLLQCINYGLIYIGVNSYWQYIIRGLIIIFAVSIDVRKYLTKK